MSKAVPYLIQGKNIILVIDGKSHTVGKDTHVAYDKIIDALKSQDWDSLRDLVEPRKAIIKFSRGYVSIDNDVVYWKGRPFHNALAKRMIDMFTEGFPIEPMVRFMENLMNNPSSHSIEQLYTFLERNSLPITEDGYFLAYKRVSSNYLDIYSGTIDNRVGTIVSMERNLVDDNPNNTCSHGLHFCSEEYLGTGVIGTNSDPVMILKINPADVVSIPVDYNGAKGRCCKYEVVAQVNGKLADTFTSSVYTGYAKSWPFTPSNEESIPDVENVGIDTDEEDTNEVLYEVRRAFTGHTEYTNVSLDVARELVKKHERQKKAKLKIFIANTDTEIE